MSASPIERTSPALAANSGELGCGGQQRAEVRLDLGVQAGQRGGVDGGRHRGAAVAGTAVAGSGAVSASTGSAGPGGCSATTGSDGRPADSGSSWLT